MNKIIPEIQPAKATGDNIMCEVEEQQAARVEVQAPKRRAVMRVESEETQDDVLERRIYGDISEEPVDEIGIVPSASSGWLQVQPDWDHGDGRRW